MKGLPGSPPFLRSCWQHLGSTMLFLSRSFRALLGWASCTGLGLGPLSQVEMHCYNTIWIGFTLFCHRNLTLWSSTIRRFGAAARTQSLRKLGTKRKSPFVRASGVNEAKHVPMFCQLEVLKAFWARPP